MPGGFPLTLWAQFSPGQNPNFIVIQVSSVLPGCEMFHQLCLLHQPEVDVIQFICSFYLLRDKAGDMSTYSTAILSPRYNNDINKHSQRQIYHEADEATVPGSLMGPLQSPIPILYFLIPITKEKIIVHLYNCTCCCIIGFYS